MFQKRQTQIKYESFFDAKINDEANIGLSIAARLLKNSNIKKN